MPRCFPWLFAICCLCVGGRTACAVAIDRTGGPRIAAVRIGFNNLCKVGSWTPVWIDINGGLETEPIQLELTAPDADGVAAHFTVAEDIKIPARTSRTLERYIKVGRVNAELSVVIRRGGQVIDQQTYSLRSADGESPTAAARVILATQFFVASFGKSIGVQDAAKLLRWRDQEKMVVAPLEDAARLPHDATGYQGVDTLIMATSSPEIIDAISDQQLEAINNWMLAGGKLLLCVGRNGEHFLGPGGRLRRFAPGEFSAVVTQRRSPGLETYVGASSRLDTGVAEFALKMTLLKNLDGVVDASEGIGRSVRPTVIHGSHGLGQIIFVGLDLDQSPFTEWRDRGRLAARLLTGKTDFSPRRMEGGRRGGRVSHLGFEDLAGQLRAGLDQFEGVTLVAFSWVAAIIIVYGLLIGPADYFFLRFGLRRMEGTWITFPLLVVLFGGLTVLLAYSWKGNQLRINQVDIVDIDATTSTVRGAYFAHLYSPVTQLLQLELQPAKNTPANEQSVHMLFSWQGLPGDGLGGMNTGMAPLIDVAYGVRTSLAASGRIQTTLEALPIQVWSSKSLSARWSGKTSHAFSSNLVRGNNERLSGDLENPLDIPLDDCYLLYGRSAYPLGRLAPQARKAIRGSARPLNLEWKLTRRQITAEHQDPSSRWNIADLDVPRILEIMMFHAAAGGQRYTKISHRYERTLDLSDQLRSGRAILFGRSKQPATQLLQDGQPMAHARVRNWCYYRIVLPVAAAAALSDNAALQPRSPDRFE